MYDKILKVYNNNEHFNASGNDVAKRPETFVIFHLEKQAIYLGCQNPVLKFHFGA